MRAGLFLYPRLFLFSSRYTTKPLFNKSAGRWHGKGRQKTADTRIARADITEGSFGGLGAGIFASLRKRRFTSAASKSQYTPQFSHVMFLPINSTGGVVKKRYLVLSEDGPLMVPPAYVIAETEEQSATLYCRRIQSKEGFMRDYVEGQSLDSFIGRLLFNDEQRLRAVEDTLPSPPIETIRAKVSTYFSRAPHSGELYIRYFEKKDRSILTEAVYEFISEQDTNGYEAIEDSTILTLQPN